MTLNQIHHFLTIARYGSFSRAAQELFLTQPALTRSIRELEQELKIRLFYRAGRGIVLSPEGEKFLYRAKELYRQYEEILTDYQDPADRRESFAVVTQHYSFAVKAFVNLVRETGMRRYDLSIRECRTREVISEVSSMRAEIGILYLSNFNRQVMRKLLRENNLEFHPLIQAAAYIYINDHHPLAGCTSVTFEMLEPYICLSFEQGEDASYYLTEELYPTQKVPRRITVNDRATMLNLMNGLDGYTICSGIIYEPLNGSGYAAVPIEDDQHETMEIGWIHRKSLELSHPARLYVEQLKLVLGAYEESKADTASSGIEQ